MVTHFRVGKIIHAKTNLNCSDALPYMHAALSVSHLLQSQASAAPVSAAERGSGCSAHSGLLEGIQGTLGVTGSAAVFTAFLSEPILSEQLTLETLKQKGQRGATCLSREPY